MRIARFAAMGVAYELSGNLCTEREEEDRAANHEEHESNKKLAGGGKPNPYFQNRNNSDTTDYGSAFGGTTDHLEES